MTTPIIINSSYEEKIDEYLKPYTDYCMFMRNNIYHSGVEYANTPFHGDYYGSFSENDSLNGVLAHFRIGKYCI